MTTDAVDLVRELKGDTCRCGGVKHPSQTFCRACYFTLPPDQRKALYRLVGEGYEEAYADAVRTLNENGRVRRGRQGLIRRTLIVFAIAALLAWLWNPLKWWLPRHGGKRSPGTTEGWVMPAQLVADELV